MKITPLNIPDVIAIEPDLYEDKRGFFFESFNQEKFNRLIDQEIIFVQDNHSKSKKGVVRGLHYQKEPFAQGKLVRVIIGEIFDVAVDIRKDSTSFGKWVSMNLSAENKKQLWIPEGFAHGFLALSEDVEIIYKTTQFYSKQHEKIIKFNDNELNIQWPTMEEYILSNEDRNADFFQHAIFEENSKKQKNTF
jgi:dTDP-4-dehydrorhamnose 3,5-epimerase